jgi:hypothetical protein
LNPCKILRIAEEVLWVFTGKICPPSEFNDSTY